jgi:hypothetical protein
MVSRELSSAAQLSSAFSEELPAQLSSAQQVFFPAQLAQLREKSWPAQLSSAQLFFFKFATLAHADSCLIRWLQLVILRAGEAAEQLVWKVHSVERV